MVEVEYSVKKIENDRWVPGLNQKESQPPVFSTKWLDICKAHLCKWISPNNSAFAVDSKAEPDLMWQKPQRYFAWYHPSTAFQVQRGSTCRATQCIAETAKELAMFKGRACIAGYQRSLIICKKTTQSNSKFGNSSKNKIKHLPAFRKSRNMTFQRY